MLKPGLKCLLGCFLLCCVSSLAADTVYMRNGTTLRGQVVGQNRAVIRLRTEEGTRVIAKRTIRRIVFGGFEEAGEEPDEKEAEVLRKLQEEDRLREERERTDQESEAESRKREEARQEAAAAEEAARESQVDPGDGSLWRSILFPGWGQYHQGRNGAGAAYAAGFTVALLATAGAGSVYASGQQRFQAAADNLNFQVVTLGFGMPLYDSRLESRKNLVFLQYFSLMERNAAFQNQQQNALALNVSGALLGAVYLANLVDVSLFEDEDLAVGFFLDRETAGLRMKFVW